MKALKNSGENSSETVTENDKKLPKERYIFPVERQKNFDNLGFNIIV